MELSDNVILALITAIPATIASLATLIVSMRNGRKADQVISATDGLKDELVRVNRSDAGRQATAVERERGEAVAVTVKAEHDRAGP